MSLNKKVRTVKGTEVSIEKPKERLSTKITLNNEFSIDLDELTYKKRDNTSTSEPATERQQKTNYLEEIDDGPKSRLSDRTDYRSNTSINVLDQLPENQELVTEESILSLEKSQEELPQELVKDELIDAQPPPAGFSTAGSVNKKNKTRTKKTSSLSKPKVNKTVKDKRRSDVFDLSKNKSESRSSVFRTNDTGNGIQIILPSYLLPNDSHYESVVWSPEERGIFLKENNFSHQQRFMTDIFHVHKSMPKTENQISSSPKYLYYSNCEPEDITVKVHIPELSKMNGLCLEFNAHVRFKKQWTIVSCHYHHKERVVTFHTNQMESFCVVSTPLDDQVIVTPEGYEYVSDADSRIKMDFPAGAVTEKEKVAVKVIPLNRESMATKIETNPRNCFILAISECLSVRHVVSEFDKPIKIQLPVDDLPGIESKNVDCTYGVFKRKHKGAFHLTDLQVDDRSEVPTILVRSFSEYVILKVRSDMFGKLRELLPEEIELAIGDKMCCKILFFVGSRKPNSMSVMLECVIKDSLEEVTQRRRNLGYELVRQCPSPDFFFPVNQRIRVDVGGRFALTKHIGKGYYFLTFFPIAADNFICFPVERFSGMETAVYGIISFKEDNGTKKDLHAIHYDPWSSKGRPQQRHINPTPRSAPVSRQPTASTVNSARKTQLDFDETFFCDKGLLAVAQSLSPDAMFQVVINLDMTNAQYEQIRSDYAQLTTSSKHLQLLKSALEINRSEPKIQRLTSALRDSGESSLAEKIEELYFEKMTLSKAGLERKNTVVTIKSDR